MMWALEYCIGLLVLFLLCYLLARLIEKTFRVDLSIDETKKRILTTDEDE
jgi:hypothetical protein